MQKKITVTAEWIKQYAQSIEFPLQSIGNKIVAPPTMPILFWQLFDVPIFHKNQPVLHGSQQFTYNRPIVEGMVLDCKLQLTKKEQKNGKQGPLTFYTYTLVCYENDEEIAQATTLLIQVGAV